MAGTLKFHEAAGIFPLLEGPELQALADDIAENGLQVPIELYQGKILDGRNRYRACLLRGIGPDSVALTLDGLDPAAYVISMNLHRRHLTASQRAMIAPKIKAYYAEQAKERQKEAGKKHGRGQKVPPDLAEAIPSDARDQAATALGISHGTVDQGCKVEEKGSKKLQQAVSQGEVSVSAAAQLTGLSKSNQDKVLKGGKKGVQAVVNPKPRTQHKASADFYEWLGSLVGWSGRLKEQYGTVAEMLAREDWDKRKTKTAASIVAGLTKTITELSKEFQKHAKD